MRYITLIVCTICKFQLVYNTTDEVDEQCKVDCACCIGRKCGPGQWFPDECTLGCIDGHTGARCYNRCTYNCTRCDYGADMCFACYDGYYPGSARDCTSKCLPGCKTCMSGTTCTSCNEGYYNADGQTDCNCHENCNCEHDMCVSCKDGYYDTSNSCNSSCPSGCKGNVCEKYSGDCTDGCTVDTIIGDKCDVCATGWYGQYCNISCSVGCKNQQCEKSNGECSNGCLDNFLGGRCNQCIPGKYGDSCNRHCPGNCDRNGCLKDSGNCINCSKNSFGKRCEKCAVGYYGSRCSGRCPSKCINSVCDRDTGRCSDGCVDNYSGDRCCINNNNCITCMSDTRCVQCKSGYFNDQCDNQCPKNCRKSCHIETGLCDRCKGNFYGDSCNFSCASTCNVETTAGGSICQQKDGRCLYGCVDGLHGLQCSEICSVYCNDTLCNQITGNCTIGCKIKVHNDLICPPSSDSSSTEQSVNTVVVILGTGFAVSVVVIFILVVTLILWKCPKRANDNSERIGPLYENSGIELQCGISANAGNVRNHEFVQVSNSDIVLGSQDYQDLGRVQVSEHEYGHIRVDTGFP